MMARAMPRRKAMEYPVVDHRPIAEIEREIVERCATDRPQTWFPAGRDPQDGAAIMRKVMRGPVVEEDVNGKTVRRRTVKIGFMKITNRGIFYATVIK
jgi:hypothetical protein